MTCISHVDENRRSLPRPDNVLGLAMNSPDLPEIVMTARDTLRLAHLVGDLFHIRDRRIALLARELDRASVVDASDICPGVVTMRSVVEFRSSEQGRLSVAMLSYPGEVRGAEAPISILTPVGTALLGLSEGQTMPYESTDDRISFLTVNRVLFQPEAAGMWWL